eukprot:TRINITY_DN7184_c0_g1_i1.p1 TRINITY_DN7184_c0_g1~~TRINITY_DN7184_c0_g1_i1.p1  ORF type:complete len:1263 (-),score=282.92 TRINITY_DN7184_c0_g1_i1:289-4077(-)
MQPAVQAGGPPPSCPLNGHDSSKQSLKPEADPHSTGCPASSKTKKRERNNYHHGLESSLAVDDSSDPKRNRRERSAISNGIGQKIEEMNGILDKNGGIYNFVGMDRLYNLMQSEIRQANVVSTQRTLLVKAIAATEREDCLNRFIQLGGLNLLSDWLQEVHRSKLGDSEKTTEELLLTILRALEKLPVDLNVLKSCHAARSVKTLKAHKNPEIHKKAKKLLDTWKKKIVGSDTKPSLAHTTKPVTCHLHKVSVEGAGSKNCSNNCSISAVSEPVGKAAPVTSSPSSPEHSGNISTGPEEKRGNNQQLPWSGKSMNQHPDPISSRSPVSANTINGKAKDYGSAKPPSWSASTGKFCSVSDKSSPPADAEPVKMESSRNQRIVVRYPNTGRGILPLPNSVEGGGVTSATKGSPQRKNRSPSPVHEAVEGKSRSSSVSRLEDCRVAPVSTKHGAVTGPDASQGINGHLDELCRDPEGEPECQSSESQHSYASLQNPQGKSVENGRNHRGSGEMVAINAEDTGISLLACIAADESLKSEKEAAVAIKDKHAKDVAEDPQKENASTEASKVKQVLGSPDESCGNPTSDAGLVVGASGFENTVCSISMDQVSGSPQKDVCVSSPAKIQREASIPEWAQRELGHDHSVDSKNENDTESGEPDFKLPGEDAIELAVQVAKEVEQEMETHESSAKEAKGADKSDVGDEVAEPGSDSIKNEDNGEQCRESQIPRDPSKLTSEKPNPTAGEIQPNSSRSPENILKSIPIRSATPEPSPENGSSHDPETSDSRHFFDLNEGVVLDENPQETTNGVCYPVASIPVIPVASHPMVLPSTSLSAPIAVVASAKGAFVSLPSPPKGSCELGWRGSAATSAFRPAEPRRMTPEKISGQPSVPYDRPNEKNSHSPAVSEERNSSVSHVAAESAKDGLGASSERASQQPLLDFDLNVADESLLQEEKGNLAPSSGARALKFDLDLNLADDNTEENVTDFDDGPKGVPNISNKNELPSTDTKRVKHNFDLNDGPNLEEPSTADDSAPFKGNSRPMANQDSASVGFRMPGEMANMGSWSQTGGPISAVAMPAFAPLRPENPYSFSPAFFSMGQGQGISSFHPDIYRPSFSASAAFSYPAQPPVFQYTGYPFGFSPTTFPAASASFLDVTGSNPFTSAGSQIITSAPMLPPHLRPAAYMGLPKMSAPSKTDRPWSRQGFDLNAGPDVTDADNREDRTSSRFIAALEGPWLAERHSSVTSESLKRKEPEGGWEFNRFGVKQESRR